MCNWLKRGGVIQRAGFKCDNALIAGRAEPKGHAAPGAMVTVHKVFAGTKLVDFEGAAGQFDIGCIQNHRKTEGRAGEFLAISTMAGMDAKGLSCNPVTGSPACAAAE